MKLDRVWDYGDIGGEGINLIMPLVSMAISAWFIGGGASDLLGWTPICGATVGLMLELCSFAIGRTWLKQRRLAGCPPLPHQIGAGGVGAYAASLCAATIAMIAKIPAILYCVPPFVSLVATLSFSIACDLRAQERDKTTQATAQQDASHALELERIRSAERTERYRIRKETQAAQAPDVAPQAQVQTLDIATRRAQVAAMLDAGQSNADIAAALQIPAYTVSRDKAAIASNGNGHG